MNCQLVVLSVLVSLSLISLSVADKPRVICYWDNSQNGLSKLKPADIDATLCTHLHYAFFVVDDQKNSIKDGAGQLQPETYTALLGLKKKNPDLKVIISVGGWGHPNDQFSHIVNSAAVRKVWMENTLQVILKYEFDGLDLDWEYPVCWQANCSAGPHSDHDNYGIFIKEIRALFDKQDRHLSLSAAVVADQPGQHIADTAYDYKALEEAFEYVSVMTYDLAAVDSKVTVHHSDYNLSVSNVEHYVVKGIRKDKVLMGAPFYGHSYRLADASEHGLGAPVIGQRDSVLGWSAYREICGFVKNDGFKKAHGDGQHDPMVYHEDSWIGYDDPYSLYEKSKWVRDKGYGGIIIWEITMDDYEKVCCSVTNPLLRAINHGLYGNGEGPETYGCEEK